MRVGIVKVECFNCGKEIYVKDNCVRDKMFCTIRCLDAYKDGATKASAI